MKLFKFNFLKKKNQIEEKENNSQEYDRYDEIGNLVKEARIQNNLSIKELSYISKIPESSINSIENNIKDLRPKYPFIRSILFKLEKCLFLKDNTLVGLAIEETNNFDKRNNNYVIGKFDFLNSWEVSIFYFLALISTLFILNRYFISNINIIEIQMIEEKAK
ncbi:possible Helix-turn-helix [Prochlorococcus marinus str. MIT 9515]|uniref:Possible Helix-turn-helix n=1 Tax=Prochlorococcus marinus (strain MIT 9515) TaxID=167542 RepID=A2BX68_PROM5|nr:helix-turn-helix domain-containing protein [Prochlorococcus marinus]ABM72379.1 possible Helix-turn-helix [Prochlorococcus marinus str. MIT 9515]